MSSDQKPGRIKVVSSGAAVPARPALPAAGSDTAATASSNPAASASSGIGWFAGGLFLLGCALGGAGLVAWPHFAG